MDELSFRLFGRFDARCGDQPIHALRHARAQELLCYLLLNRERPHHREQLAAQLWGDAPTAQARKQLRQALWQLQSAFRPLDVERGAPVLAIETAWIGLDRDATAGLWVDVFEFLDTFQQAQGVAPGDLGPAQVRAARRAVDLYRGDILDGWPQEWCQAERQRFQGMVIVLADKLVSHCEARGLYELGTAYAARILRLDRAHERTHRRLMRMHYRAGDRTAALRQYQRCRAALAEELGVAPSATTEQLYARVAALDDGPDLPGEPDPAAARGDLMPEILERLRQVQVLLDALHDEVRPPTVAGRSPPARRAPRARAS